MGKRILWAVTEDVSYIVFVPLSHENHSCVKNDGVDQILM
jgi:hypothetical protein